MKKQRQALVSNVRKFIDSLESHLDYCVQRNPAGKDTRLFHVETTVEYAEAILKALKALR